MENNSALLKDILLELSGMAKEAIRSSQNGTDSFQLGRNFGIYESISLIIQQMEIFGLDLEKNGICNDEFGLDLLK
jgi:hypothetical protein